MFFCGFSLKSPKNNNDKDLMYMLVKRLSEVASSITRQKNANRHSRNGKPSKTNQINS